MDWLLQYPAPVGTEYGYQEFIDSVDTIIMGNGTYKEIIAMQVDWPYKGLSTYVLTRHKNNLPPKENVTYITDDAIAAIRQLQQQEGKDI
ncbi:MAG: hypothetical protein LBK65_05695 [Tannerellaceae bacterium]|nr:hypothetical protein [Tannerellaceae bacterium]